MESQHSSFTKDEIVKIQKDIAIARQALQTVSVEDMLSEFFNSYFDKYPDIVEIRW